MKKLYQSLNILSISLAGSSLLASNFDLLKNKSYLSERTTYFSVGSNIAMPNGVFTSNNYTNGTDHGFNSSMYCQERPAFFNKNLKYNEDSCIQHSSNKIIHPGFSLEMGKNITDHIDFRIQMKYLGKKASATTIDYIDIATDPSSSASTSEKARRRSHALTIREYFTGGVGFKAKWETLEKFYLGFSFDMALLRYKNDYYRLSDTTNFTSKPSFNKSLYDRNLGYKKNLAPGIDASVFVQFPLTNNFSGEITYNVIINNNLVLYANGALTYSWK